MVWHHGRAPRDNPRFVITNLRQTPAWIDRHGYGARGDSENRLKELKLAAAFGLYQELQLRADRTALRGAQVPRLRQAPITIGVQVVRSVRRIGTRSRDDASRRRCHRSAADPHPAQARAHGFTRQAAASTLDTIVG